MMDSLLLKLTARMPARAIDLDGRHYIERYHVGRLFGVTAYLHRYLGSDGDRQLHDHPWDWSVGIPLVGGYDEERLVRLDPKIGARTRMRRIWRFRPNLILGRTFHRIASVWPGTWTLFIHARRTASWGFMEIMPATMHSLQPSDFWMLYRPALGTVDSAEAFANWHASAPAGAQLRAARGT